MNLIHSDHEMALSMFRRAFLIIPIALFAVAATCSSVIAQDKSGNDDPTPAPKRPYTISKETTYFTGPLKPDGSIDFIAAVNDHFSQGVTPENNAALIIVPLLPKERWSSDEQREKILAALGLDPANYVDRDRLRMNSFIESRIKDKDQFNTDWKAATRRPWTKDELPLLSEWLQQNESAFTEISSAATLPRYYVPLVGDEKTGDVMTALLDDSQILRFVGRVLAIRANNHLGERRWNEAWRDILTILNLSRLIGQGQSWVHSSTSNFLAEFASKSAGNYINSAPFGEIEWSTLMKEWPNSSPTNFRDQTGIMERAIFIQLSCQIWDEPERTIWLAQPPESRSALLFNRIYVESLRQMIESRELDLDEVFRFANPLYDQAAAVFEESENPSNLHRAMRWKISWSNFNLE